MNYTSVLEEIRSLSRKYNGSSNAVTLLAVSKLHSYEEILEAYSEGARLFGENHVQEIVEKFPLPGDRPEGMKVYMIGHLQTNKVKKVVPLVDRIESVDSIKLLNAINKECGKLEKKMDILFEINSSGEEQKSGFRSEEEIVEALAVAKSLKWVNLIGFMTVGPLGFDKEKNIEAFKGVKLLYDRYKTSSFKVLSMGMSADKEEAILCGSTECRIGSAIFGARDYGKKTC